MASTPIPPPNAGVPHQTILPQTIVVTVRARTVFKVLAITGLMLAAGWLIIILAPFWTTLAIASFLAIAADPAVRFLQNRGMGRTPAVLTFFAILVLLLITFVGVFVGPLVTQGERLIDESPGW